MGLAEYQQKITEIRLKHNCTAKEAREIYLKGGGNEKPKTKSSKTKTTNAVSKNKTVSTQSESELLEKAAQLESFFLGNRQNASAMERTAKSFLGDNCTMHRSILKPNECWFIAGDIRVPKEGVLIVKFK